MSETPEITDAILREVALTRSEYERIVQLLGRPPRPVELGMFGAMWSEHCGYKNSRPLLKRFPTSGAHVLQGPGENAGAVDIGDGQALVLKIESHNHPSALEPYQGAATGVGGIIRDIFTMGARPIALLDSLRFGPLSEARNRYLFGGVVGGIAGYGNCIGIPTVGGETFFHPSYNGNPLVNAMCVGLIDRQDLTRATAGEPGNLVLLVGAATGRDGVHGATFASVELSADSEERRSAVQVGDPFTEKLLLEACIELCRSGEIVGMQDLGAAGLTSSSVEVAAHGGVGIEIDLAKAPRRAANITAYEMMLSESQERMLVVVTQEKLEGVLAVFARWELPAVVIGAVTADGLVRVREGAEIVAEVPASYFTDECPVYQREGQEAAEVVALRRYDTTLLPEPADNAEVLLTLLSDPSLCSKAAIWRRYDHMVGTNTVVAPGSDAAILRVKGTPKGVALTTDCNARHCYLNPYAGGAGAVVEAALNLAVSGARPLCVTDCLNFGNPERPEVYYQLERAVQGISDACRALEIPVVSGNVSLYNESTTGAVYPTPVIGMAGLLDDVTTCLPSYFQSEGAEIALLGSEAVTLGGSAFLSLIHGRDAGDPLLPDLEATGRLITLLTTLAREGVLESAHDCAEGGLAVAVAESAMGGRCGATLSLPEGVQRPSHWLFGEGPGRVLVSFRPHQRAVVEHYATESQVGLQLLGRSGGDALLLQGTGGFVLPLERLQSGYEGGLTRS